MADLADRLKTHIRHRQAKGATWAELLMLYDAWELALDARPPSARTLTPRQAELLPLILSGLTMKASARQLGLDPSTVKDHAACIYKKYGVTNRHSLVARFHPAGHGR